MPLRWLRRLRGGGKSAGSPAHPPNRAWPSNWPEGDAILENPSTKAGGPEGPSEALPPCPRTTVAPQDYGQRTTGSLSGPAPPATPPLCRTSANTDLLAHSMRQGGKHDRRRAGRLKAGRPSLESGSATARTLQRLDRPPGSPPPRLRKNFLRHYQTVFSGTRLFYCQ